MTGKGWWVNHSWRLIRTNLREIDTADIDAADETQSMREVGPEKPLVSRQFSRNYAGYVYAIAETTREVDLSDRSARDREVGLDPRALSRRRDLIDKVKKVPALTGERTTGPR